MDSNLQEKLLFRILVVAARSFLLIVSYKLKDCAAINLLCNLYNFRKTSMLL